MITHGADANIVIVLILKINREKQISTHFDCIKIQAVIFWS